MPEGDKEQGAFRAKPEVLRNLCVIKTSKFEVVSSRHDITLHRTRFWKSKYERPLSSMPSVLTLNAKLMRFNPFPKSTAIMLKPDHPYIHIRIQSGIG